MRIDLIPATGRFYKANLHSHTNVSDGHVSPEELKKIYKDHGYSIVAFTDHDVFITHNDLTDGDFLALNGYELAVRAPSYPEYALNLHMCWIALDPEKKVQKYYYKTKFIEKNPDTICLDPNMEPLVREYTGEYISDLMKKGREDGFFVTYNHPQWSLETLREYGGFEGMNALEVYNHGCVVAGYEDCDIRVYDEMLRDGKQIYCIASDDCHLSKPVGDRRCDALGGFTMIKAENLDYRTITKALLDGYFYASNGPLIDELFVEDGRIYVRCPAADKIVMNTGHRRASVVYAKEGEPLTEASFELRPNDRYVRISVFDKEGHVARTNAYFPHQVGVEPNV